MGCVPPQKRQQSSAAASVAVKKSNSLKNFDNKNKITSPSTQNQNPRHFVSPSSNRKLKNISKEQSNASSPKFKSISDSPVQTMVYSKNFNSPDKVSERHSIRVLPPSSSTKDAKNGELEKIASVHQLDLNSRINLQSNHSKKKIEERKRAVESPKEQLVNITFNNNNFGTANCSRAGTASGKRWKEQLLQDELKGINDQQFRKINVDTMEFD